MLFVPWISNFNSYWACDYLSMLELTLIHVSKKGLDCIKIGKVWSIRVICIRRFGNLSSRLHVSSSVTFHSCMNWWRRRFHTRIKSNAFEKNTFMGNIAWWYMYKKLQVWKVTRIKITRRNSYTYWILSIDWRIVIHSTTMEPCVVWEFPSPPMGLLPDK